jgi:GTP-binding protein
MLLHLVSLENEDPAGDYLAIRNELGKFDTSLLEKREWIILTKMDLVDQAKIDAVVQTLDNDQNRVFVISCETGEGVKNLRDSLVKMLGEG